MSQASLLGRRVRVRLQAEVFLKDSVKPWSFRRLPRTQIQFSAPNAEQAQLFLNALFDFAESLNGKLLLSSSSVVSDSNESLTLARQISQSL